MSANVDWGEEIRHMSAMEGAWDVQIDYGDSFVVCPVVSWVVVRVPQVDIGDDGPEPTHEDSIQPVFWHAGECGLFVLSEWNKAEGKDGAQGQLIAPQRVDERCREFSKDPE